MSFDLHQKAFESIAGSSTDQLTGPNGVFRKKSRLAQQASDKRRALVPLLSSKDVSSEDTLAGKGSSKKRRRREIACLSCRSAKVKCDRERPTCGGCVQHGEKCVYVAVGDASAFQELESKLKILEEILAERIRDVSAKPKRCSYCAVIGDEISLWNHILSAHFGEVRKTILGLCASYEQDRPPSNPKTNGGKPEYASQRPVQMPSRVNYQPVPYPLTNPPAAFGVQGQQQMIHLTKQESCDQHLRQQFDTPGHQDVNNAGGYLTLGNNDMVWNAGGVGF